MFQCFNFFNTFQSCLIIVRCYIEINTDFDDFTFDISKTWILRHICKTLNFIPFISVYLSSASHEWDACTIHEYIDGLVQERRNSSALAVELHLSCTNPVISYQWYFVVVLSIEQFYPYPWGLLRWQWARSWTVCKMSTWLCSCALK